MTNLLEILTLVDIISCLMSSHREHLLFGVYKLWKMEVEGGAYQVWCTDSLILSEAEKCTVGSLNTDILSLRRKLWGYNAEIVRLFANSCKLVS